MPIAPQFFLAGLILCIIWTKTPQNFLVKNAIFYEFLKLGLFSMQLREMETGPGMSNQDIGASFELKSR